MKSNSIDLMKIIKIMMNKLDVINATLDCLAIGFGAMKKHMKDLKVLPFNSDDKEETTVKLELPTMEHTNSR